MAIFFNYYLSFSGVWPLKCLESPPSLSFLLPPSCLLSFSVWLFFVKFIQALHHQGSASYVNFLILQNYLTDIYINFIQEDAIYMHDGMLLRQEWNSIIWATWMDLGIIILSEVKVRQKKTDTIWYHLYVESKTWHKWIHLQWFNI